jgi:putative FmdB family regulatory protein
MPVYEYRCLDCDKTFEIVETLSEHATSSVSGAASSP